MSHKQQSHPFVMPRPGKKGFCVLVDECRRKIDDCVHKNKQIKKRADCQKITVVYNSENFQDQIGLLS